MRNLLLFLVFTSAAFGVQTWVQNGPSTCRATSGNTACAIAGVTAGNTLHIGIAYRTGTLSISSVVSTLGNTPALIKSDISNGTVGVWLYCMPITTGGAETITVNMGNTYFWGTVLLQEFSGSSCTADGTGSNAVTVVSSCSTSSFTPVASNTIIASVGYSSSSANDLAAGSGYATNAVISNNSGTTRGAGIEYKIVTASAAQTPSWSTSPSNNTIVCVGAALQASGGAATPIRHRVTGQ